MNIVNNLSDVIGDVDAGVLERIIGKALGDTAAGVMDHKRKGKITLTLDFAHIKNTSQVSVKSAVKIFRPTMDEGESTEVVKRETAFYVGKFGKLSIVPEAQFDLPGFTKDKGAPPAPDFSQERKTQSQ